MDNNKTVVLYSGGLDSTTVLAQALHAGENVLAVTIDYGQHNADEVKRCRTLAGYWGFKHKVVEMRLDRVDPGAEIPARNTLFLAKALEQALIFGATKVAYGAEPDATYTDSSVPYIEAMNAVFRLHGVTLTAPIKGLQDKKEVVMAALDLGVPLDLVHSSLSNSTAGGNKTANRFLSALVSLFPQVNPVWLLESIAQAHYYTNTNPYYLVSPQTDSFKWLPALFLLGSVADMGPIDVFTTGNWGRSLRAASMLTHNADIRICHTTKVEELAENELNTDSVAAQWGIKQALSRLPRPQFLLNTPLYARFTQGHLARAISELGYTYGTVGIPLITEAKRCGV